MSKRALISEYIASNGMTKTPKVHCSFFSFITSEDSYFDIYTNRDYIFLVNLNSRFFLNISLFDSNYIIPKQENDDFQIIKNYFQNYIEPQEINIVNNISVIQGNLFSKTIFSKDLILIGKIKLEISATV